MAQLHHCARHVSEPLLLEDLRDREDDVLASPNFRQPMSFARQWWEDAQVLAELGRTFEGTAMPVVEVRIPKHLAEQALATWRRDDDGPDVDEPQEQRVYHHRAGVLALIGLSIKERGKNVPDAVVVDLAADLIAAAVDAAEDP